MKNYYATFIFLITIIPLYSQKAPIKFGKVDRSDLEMTYYDKDSTVAAVILCDYGYFNSNDFSFTRLLRIKILKKEGYSWANRSFNTYSKASIRGRTYNLENGEIEEEKLKNSSIYRERVTGSHYIMKVTMPNVKVGSVIDFEYSYVGFPNEWRFQETIPVCWSELILEPSIYIEFQKNFFGFEPLDVQTSSRWVAKDMPAFKEEPYMNSMENYLTKFEFDIMQISYQGYFRDFTTSWDAVSEFLLNHAYFGDVLIGSDYLKSTIKDIKSESDLKQDQLEAAFNAVKRVKWNEQQRIFAFSNNLSFVWKDEIGNSAEINLILYQLLKKLDFEAFPVVISTRENGMLSPVYPSLNKLNHVIVYVKNNGNDYLLDATEDYMPFSLLPKKCLNWSGHIISRHNSDWINITTDKKDKQLSYYNLNLNEDLTITGQISYLKNEYAAYDFRKKYYSFNSEQAFLEDFLKDKPGLEIIHSTLKNIDTLTLPVKEIYDVKIREHIEKLGDELLIYPFLYERIEENPFKLDHREYPIDFGYATEKNVIINITLPDNYEIVEIPEATKVNLPDYSGYFLFQCNALGNLINLNYKYYINKELFVPEEYLYLKEFMNQIIKLHAKPIVVKAL